MSCQWRCCNDGKGRNTMNRAHRIRHSRLTAWAGFALLLSMLAPIWSLAATTVSLTAPVANQNYKAPATIVLAASATASSGTLTKVVFYRGATVIGTATTPPYTVTWSTSTVGSYSLTAKATDSSGAITTSGAIPIKVVANQSPTVVLTVPAANQSYKAPAIVVLTANATDADGTIAKVVFYRGTTVIGTATTAPYTVTWSSAAAGSYSLTAKATDNNGKVTTSAAIPITVIGRPTVSFTSPGNGAVFIVPAMISLTAKAEYMDNPVAKVEFYQGTTLIGTAKTAPYAANWTNVAAGHYTLSVRATDTTGATHTSTPVGISVIVNQAPTVSLTSPINNQTFPALATVLLMASATDAENDLAKVEFFQNGTQIGMALQPPYTAHWTNVAAGSYQVTAVATDAVGVQATSSPVPITVGAQQPTQHGRVYYIHADHLDAPRVVTDPANTVVWRNLPTTEPFGNSPPEEDPDADGTRFEFNLRFPGQYFDQETQTHYNYFRDYDPGTGRYVQSDPIGLQGGINTYSYVNGNPVGYSDPLGLQATIPGPGGIPIPLPIPTPKPGGKGQGSGDSGLGEFDPWTGTNTETRTPSLDPKTPSGPRSPMDPEGGGACRRMYEACMQAATSKMCPVIAKPPIVAVCTAAFISCVAALGD